jgi:hypothetical protein
VSVSFTKSSAQAASEDEDWSQYVVSMNGEVNARILDRKEVELLASLWFAMADNLLTGFQRRSVYH